MTQVVRDKMTPGKSGAGETPDCRAHGSNSPKHPPNGGIMMGPWIELLENRAISGAQKGVLLKIARLIEPIIVP